MTIPDWLVSSWLWLGIGLAFFGTLALSFWVAIIAVNHLGMALFRKLRNLYALSEIRYWLDQHKKHGKIMMSDDTGKLVWVSTKKGGGDE